MLEEIVTDVRRGLAALQARESDLRAEAELASTPRDFGAALCGAGLAVISEFKRASPSRGVINSRLDPAVQAVAYEAGGAAALSVLTEPRHFGGSASDLEAAKAATSLPVIRKDFTLDPLHVWEARAMGADAVLLIVSIVDDVTLRRLLGTVHQAGMAALVEIHDRSEAERAIDAGASIIGVNNRDLSTLGVDLGIAERLAPALANVDVRVAESGIHGPGDVARMKEAGYDAVLVGEYLVRADDPAAAIAGLKNA